MLCPDRTKRKLILMGQSVTYGTASFFGMYLLSVSRLLSLHSNSGSEYTDTVTIAPGLSIFQQGIGVASSSAGFNGVDGILG
jgi:hypothetical protein